MKKLKIVAALVLTSITMLQSCKKSSPTDNTDNPGGGTTTTTTTTPGNGTGTNGAIVAGTDPAVATTQGFFLDNWAAKTWSTPSSTLTAPKQSTSNAIEVSVDLSQVITKISTTMYGNNTNPYMGQYVTEPVLMNNLSNFAPKVLRAPGGSLSDVYFWNGNGTSPVAPADAPANLLDGNGIGSPAYYWFGNNTASFTFTLDNYYKVLQQTGSTGLITVNYGYARYGTSAHPDQTAAHLAANWVRYDKGKTQYWEVGNECYGSWEAGYRIDVSKNKDGQPEFLTGTVYGKHFKVFADSMRAAAAEVGNANIKIGIVLTTDNDVNNNSGVKNWNSDVLKAAGNSADYFVVHNYYTPYNENSTPATIFTSAGNGTASMMNWVKTSAQNANVNLKPVAMDEWNMFASGSGQNVSNIAGLHAVMVLGEVLKNQISLATRWDLANGWSGGDDHGLFNIGDEPNAAKWNARPSYYYMWFFKNYIGDRLVASSVTNNGYIASYGSTFSSGQAGVILVNQGSTDQVVKVTFKNYLTGTNYYYWELNGGTDNVPFSRKVYVNGTGPAGVSGGPANFNAIAPIVQTISGGITAVVPAYGAVFLVADKQ